ncbi:MAG: MBL fold metallo-hydrolase [Bullifex sp.]
MAEVMFLGVNGSVQDRESGNTSLLFRSGDVTLMVDASSGLHAAVEASPDALVITHTHTDHVYGLSSLIHQMWLTGRKKELRIYASEGTMPLVSGIISLFGLDKKKGMFPMTFSTASCFNEGPFAVETFRTDHTDSSVGLFIREDGGARILYTSDTRPISGPDEKWMGAALLIHEASGSAEDEKVLVRKGHSSYSDAASLALKLGASHLMLCHLPAGEESKRRAVREASGIFPEVSYAQPLKWMKI